jgi:citrate lyase subunit beta/citryl-CoA lyase
MTRSILFVPGDSPKKVEKALASEADALVLDLEDSVAAEKKAEARANVAQWLSADRGGKTLWVRVNPLESGLMLEDLAAVIPSAPFGIMVPKCSGRSTLEPVSHYLDAFEAAARLPRESTKILAIATETAKSIFSLGDYVNVTSRLWGLTWGGEDLGADVGSLTNRDGRQYTEPYRLVRSLCLFAAAAAGVRPYDAVCVALDDEELLLREAREAFRDGFVGKMAIHPKHIDSIHRAFTPTPEEAGWAKRVVEAFEGAPESGALRMDGKMIDLPHLRLAKRLIQGQ